MKKAEHRHFALYKPYGYLSQFVNHQKRRKNKKLLGELFAFPKGTMAIGRLDQSSEGLLLLTTDGKTSEAVRSKHFEKQYLVQVDGSISTQAIEKLNRGLSISINGESYETLPSKTYKLDNPPKLPERSKKVRDERHGPTSWLSITLREGKFRQVRKMTAAVGHPTLRLVRIRVGNTHLSNMQPGEVIELDGVKM